MEGRKPPTRTLSGGGGSGSDGLGSFLNSAPKTKTSRGSATVSGPMVHKDEEGEIYIRPDGKKVRRVKKTVPKSAESSDAGLGSFLNESESKLPKKKASGSATVTGYTPTKKLTSSKSADEGEIYIRPDGKKVRRVKRAVSSSGDEKPGLAGFLDSGTSSKPKMSGSATVTGYTPSKINKLSSASAGSSKDDGEIYIRADGKKVRRVKKTVSATEKTEDPPKVEIKEEKKSEAKMDAAKLSKEERKKKNLESFLKGSSGHKAKKSKGGSASVTGDVYSSSKKKDLGDFLLTKSSGKKKKGGAASVSGIPTGSAKLSKSAEDFAAKYRKKKTPAAETKSDEAKKEADVEKPAPFKASSGLSGFLDAGTASKPKMSGSATVTGSTPTRKLTSASSAASSKDDGEVYIRADGKKVRRVKKSLDKGDSVTASSTESGSTAAAKKGLGNFLDTGASTKPKKMSGSATVTGYTPSKLSSAGSKEEGEVYIRPDGKKVRRIRKTKSTDDAEPDQPANGAGAGPGLGGFLGSQEAVKKPMGGSATVTGAAMSSKKSLEGEIYINKDGKKVRRVRKTPALSSAGDLATSSTPATASNSAEASPAKPALAGFLNSSASAKPKMSGSATVTGYTPSKTIKSSSSQEGEIYIRPDGKKVRRIRKPKPEDGADTSASSATVAPTSLSSLSDPKPKNNGASTVAGETVIKVTPEGEIVLRADGKKVLRRKKTTAETAAAAAPEKSDDNSEVYRRADGKLVRRVRKGGKPTAAAGDLAGFMNNQRSNTPRNDGDNATVTGNARPKTSIEDLMNLKNTRKGLPELDPNVDVSKLTAEQFAIAGSYRIMLQQGLSAEQVHSRMVQDGVDKIIISAVLQEDLSLSPHRSPNVLGDKPNLPSVAPLDPAMPNQPSTSKLSAEEEALAATYRKMAKMGLPSDAIKHKMVQDGASRDIIVAVLGEDAAGPSTAEPASDSPEAGKENSPESGLSPDEEAIASRFRKMCKMGLPTDSVRHKMQAEGVDEKIVQSVLGEQGEAQAAAPIQAAPATGSNLTADDEVEASKYRKMFKMGLPEDAVRQKMSVDGVAPHIIASVMGEENAPAGTAAPVVLTPDEEALASKYRKIAKMGLPQDAVKHKMVQDGVPDHIIASVLSGDDPAAGAASPTAPVQTSSGGESATVPEAQSVPATAAASSLSPEDEEIATKYREMFKAGLPEDAVRQKMSMDDAAPHIMDAVIGVAGTPTAAAQAVAAAIAPTAATVVPSAGQESTFAVIMSPDPTPTPPPVALSAPLDPNEKFAVDVDSDKKLDGDVETRFMTLEDIAKATGQDPEKLKEMVKQRRDSSATMPRFVLTPVNERPAGDVFEVAVPKTAGAAVAAGGTPSSGGPSMADAGLDPKKKYKEVNVGQEVVDSKLADAARAVSALGDMDMKSLLEQLQKGELEALLGKLADAEKRQKKLEKQLAQSGIAIAEDIDYGEAKTKVDQIAKRMGEIGGSDVTRPDKEEQNKLREEYFKLEQEMERYNTALMLTEEYQAEQDRLEKKWEDDNRADNLEALKKIRRHMPVKIRHMSEAELCNTPSPNGKFLPKAIAKKFKRTNVLQAIRLNPDDLERMHPSTLENMRVTGLTLTERRALYYHLQSLGPKWEKNKAEKMTERKWTWYQMMKSNFKENLAPYKRHVDQYGPPDNHVGCPLLGKQCPIKADKLIDYDNDYGWPDGDEFEVSDVKKADVDDPGAKAMQEALELAKTKKANERADLLKKHYKGKLLQVSKANGSCEAMDEAMDKMEFGLSNWIEFKLDKADNLVEADKKKEVANFTEGLNTLKLAALDFAQRSGMQISGKKKAGGDAEDIRSAVEASLADEVWEMSQVYFKFIQDRMKETEQRDTRVQKTIELLEGMLGELHSKNEALLKKLGTERRERSRELKQTEKIQKEMEEKIKAKKAAEMPPEEEEEAAPAGPPGGGGGRGGLLDAIGGRGRGRGGGRGGLLDAIAGGRGRGRGRGGEGGRGGLLDAIASGRGRGRGRGGGGDEGGRGGLMAAIAAGRTKGRGGGGGDGGRGGLMAAIAARGSGRGGRGGGGDGGGGRGGLMAAIAARGGGGG